MTFAVSAYSKLAGLKGFGLAGKNVERIADVGN